MLKLKQYFGHLMRRADSFEKTLMLGKIEDRRRRGWQRMRWLDGISDSTDMDWVDSGSWWWTGRPGVLRFMGSQRVGHDWATELNFQIHTWLLEKKATALTRWTFVGKVMSLVFNMLSRLVIAFLPRSQVSFDFMAAVTVHSDFGAQENKVCPSFHCFPICLPWIDGTRCHDLCFSNVEF